MKCLSAGAVLLSAVLLSGIAESQETGSVPPIVTDRPDVTESSIVVPAASFQLENGITWTDDHGVGAVDAAETLVRYGLSARTELRLVTPNYSANFTQLNAPSGFGDLAIGMKQQIGPLWKTFELSVIAALSLPTGANRISSHGFDPFIKFPWSREFGSGWSIGGMQSLFWNTLNGKRDLVWEPTFMAEKEITEPWSVFVEYAGDFAQIGGSKQMAHFGTAYRITPRQQIDAHFGFGVSPAAPSHFFAVGYSIRIDRRPQR